MSSVGFAPWRLACVLIVAGGGLSPQLYLCCHTRGSRTATVRVREGGSAVRLETDKAMRRHTRDARWRITQLAMECKSLLDPTNSFDGQFEEINLEGGAADGSKTLRPPASKVDLESLRRTPVWNVVVNSVTYMASASQPLPGSSPPARPAVLLQRTHHTSSRSKDTTMYTYHSTRRTHAHFRGCWLG